MEAFLDASLGYPTLIFTALLGVAMAYWLLVSVGVLGVDLLGDAEIELGDAADAGADGGNPQQTADAASAFRLRQVPVTVALTLLLFFGWLASHLASHYVLPQVVAVTGRGIAGTVLLVASSVVAYFMARFSVVPLAPLFRTHEATRRRDLIGKVISVRTGSVDRKFGQGLLEEGGQALLLEVRCDPARQLGRGQQALLVSYDDEANAFDVEPMEDVLPSREKSAE